MGISKKNKEALCIFHNYKCEICKILKKAKKLSINELEIHKINSEKGYEDHRNLRVLCVKHHEILSSALRMASGIQSQY
jgi:hypothetical protein